MKRAPLRFVSLCALLATTAVAGCQCVDPIDFVPLPDGGVEAGPSPPPPPPKYPLRAGDELVFRGLGGRTEPCNVEGACDRVLDATYTIKEITLDEEANRWSVKADFLYEMRVAKIEAAAMAQLFLSRVAPYAELDEGGAMNDTATFSADAAPTDALRANDFPFFHFEPEYATKEDSAYQAARIEFTERITELDPDANIEAQAAAAKFEAYFKDTLGANPFLHKIRVDLHPMGFICAWDERLIPWQDGMARNEGAFASATGIPLAAVFPGQVTLFRDDVRYNCSCFTKQCRRSDDPSQCLDPKNPDAANTLDCACLGANPPDSCP